MKAAALSGILRQLGLTFIVCLVLSIRIDDRPVLLALQAAAMAWQLRRLQAFAASPEAQRAWRGAIGSAVVCVPLGVIGLVPAVDPGLVTILGSILLLFGVASYGSLLAHWSRRTDWSDAAVAFDRARLGAVVGLGVVGAGVAALLVLAPSAQPADRLADSTIVLDRVVDGWAPFAVVLLVLAAWAAALISLQIGNRTVRAGLRAQPEAQVPLA